MTTRRGFLGWLTAGAAAGPAVAQEVVSNLTSPGASFVRGTKSSDDHLTDWEIPKEAKPKYEDPIKFIRDRNVQKRLRHMEGEWDFNDIENGLRDRFSWWPF